MHRGTLSWAFLSLALIASLAPAQYTVGPAGQPFASIAGVPGVVPLTLVSGCDDCTETVNLSFAFPWFGSVGQTSVIVSSNGAVIFDGQATQTLCCSAWALDNGTAGGTPVIFTPVSRASVIQEDLDPAGVGSGDILSLDTGVSMIISFENCAWFPGPINGSANGQIELFANGEIEIRLGNILNAGNDFACGLSDYSNGVTSYVSPSAVIPEFNAFGVTTGAIAPAAPTGVRFVPSGAQYQVNTADASLDVDGVQGTAFNPAGLTVGVGTMSNLNLGSALMGVPHDVLIGSAALVPQYFVSANGQVVNMDLSDPTMFFLYGANTSDPLGTIAQTFTGNYAFPFTTTSPFSGTAQGLFVNAGNPDGFSLTAPVTYDAVPCSATEGFEGLTPNNGSTTAAGPYPIGWSDGGGAAQWQVRSGTTSSVATGPLTGAFSGTNYMYCETSVPNNPNVMFILRMCPYDFTGLSNFNLDFRLSRLGATIGTLNVLLDDGSGAAPTLLATYTGPEPAGADWTAESISLIPFLPTTGVGTIVFEYTSGASFTGDVAIDDFSIN